MFKSFTFHDMVEKLDHIIDDVALGLAVVLALPMAVVGLPFWIIGRGARRLYKGVRGER